VFLLEVLDFFQNHCISLIPLHVRLRKIILLLCLDFCLNNFEITLVDTKCKKSWLLWQPVHDSLLVFKRNNEFSFLFFLWAVLVADNIEMNSLARKILINFIILKSLDTKNSLALILKLLQMLTICCLFVGEISAVVDINEFVYHVIWNQSFGVLKVLICEVAFEVVMTDPKNNPHFADQDE